MAAAPQDADLGLNLVFESVPAPTPKAARASTKKRKNKYDRRREKGRLAKLAKEEEDVVEPKSENDAAEIHASLASVISEKIVVSTEAAAAHDDVNMHAAEKAESQNGRLSNINDKPSIQSTSATNNAVLGNTSIAKAVVVSSAAAPNQTASSRRNRVQQTLSEEEERARYLSEFHARPLDLDRNEKASKEIKASLASDHIFDNEYLVTEVSNGMDENNPDNDEISNCPFRRLGLDPNICRALTNPEGYFKLNQPTIVQSRAVEILLPSTKGKCNRLNLFIQSETGSGKTLAYLLPILHHLAVDLKTNAHKRVDRQLGGTRAILLMPTRELSTQTYNVANHLCSKSFPWIIPGCLSGGEKRKSEKARLRKGITILIATPGRLLDHLNKTESLMVALKGKLEWFVLDEADRLLDAGLGGQVEQIVQHLRSNQPRAGVKRDGVTWRSILVSATVTSAIEGLAKTTMGGEDWKWARGHKEKTRLDESSKVAEDGAEDGFENDSKLLHSAPRQLAQLYMVVSAKLRLSSLIAFLASRASKNERTVVFMSTCDGVDYHHALFNSMTSVFANDDDDDCGGGIFGKSCPCYKLHGDIPQAQRLDIINQFSGGKNCPQKSSILLATDVAARGLNLPELDWIVQYDPPCETNDYIHRAGRSARAGKSGHSLLFLLPSERQYVEVLQLRGLKEITALSLSATLNSAANLCPSLSQEGDNARPSDKTFLDGKGEAFTLAIQNRLEQCVIQDDADYKASIEKKVKDAKQRRKLKKDTAGPLLVSARKAFSAFVRAYPAKERAVKHIFNARGLHLGHIARSLALREAPKVVSKVNSGAALLNGEAIGKRKSKFELQISSHETDEDMRILSMVDEDLEEPGTKKRRKEPSTKGTSLGKDAQKKMMEQAMRLQNQGMEFM